MSTVDIFSINQKTNLKNWFTGEIKTVAEWVKLGWSDMQDFEEVGDQKEGNRK